MNKEALFYKKKDKDTVQCNLCPHLCKIDENATGNCGVRRNIDGMLCSENYSQCTTCVLDPIEKKPLYHFYPGTNVLSVGSVGCNFVCQFCQNWSSSQDLLAITKPIYSDQLITLTQEHEAFGIAYTYNEPIVSYEYVLDIARIVKQNNLLNVLVTNGYVMEEPLKYLLPYIDALNIDIKSMSDAFYKKYCNGSVGPVLDACVTAKKDAHVELTNMIIPTLNDKDDDFKKLGNWVKENLGSDTPMHISRYFPQYKMSIERTPIETLKRAKEILESFLDYVYVGNSEDFDNNTYCKECGEIIVARLGYSVSCVSVMNQECNHCGASINLINNEEIQVS